MAIYDGRADGEIAARAYLITVEQFVDVLAQEIRQEPDVDVDLNAVRETGWHSLGPGRYQTLAHLGDRDELPMLTFTSADVNRQPRNAPTEGYLRTIAVGLRESHCWTSAAIGRYLAPFPGAAGTWTRTRSRRPSELSSITHDGRELAQGCCGNNRASPPRPGLRAPVLTAARFSSTVHRARQQEAGARPPDR